MEHMNVDLDDNELYDQLVHRGLIQASDIHLVTKAKGTLDGNPLAVLAFKVKTPAGQVRVAQAVTTVKLLQQAFAGLFDRYGNLMGKDVKVRDYNPGATLNAQLNGHWQQLMAVLVWKLAKDGVTLTAAEIGEYSDLAHRGEAVLMTYGHSDSIDLKIVTAEAAREIATYDQSQVGTS